MAARCREYAAKTKALLSRAITALLICAFVFTCSHKAGFFRDVVHIIQKFQPSVKRK